MGILDEAIRQHLDLKRLHGAEDSEVKKLEDEAFGLPTRPGEPDFPESQEHSVVPAEGDEKAPETTVAEAPASAPVAEPEPEPEPPAEPEAPAPEPEPAPADERVPTEPVSEEPPEEEPTAFYDHAGVEEDELEDSADDLLEEAEAAEKAPASEEPPAAEEPPPAAEQPPASEEQPITSMETVEHPMEELLEADPEGAPPESPAPGEEEGLEEDPDAGDVLEETPEFLRDQPEDEELWFEQGEPKDFDFD